MNDLTVVASAIEASFILSRGQDLRIRRIGRGYAFDVVSPVPEFCLTGEAPSVELLLLEIAKAVESNCEKQAISLSKSKELLSCGR